MKRNTLDDVKATLAGSTVEVIDLLPGERWDVGDGTISRLENDRSTLYEPTRIAAYMDQAIDPETFAAHHPSEEGLTRPELVEYLDRLNAVPEIANCEDLTARIRALSSAAGRSALDVSFAVAGGRLRVLSEPPALPNLTITIPLGVLAAVVRDGLSWDEAFIGYWCRFDRDPNVYHAGFWRLLQAPYFKKPVSMPMPASGAIGRTSIVAEVLEAYGPEADRVFRRHGLYCLGCHHSTAESIESAARQHGVNAHGLDLLLRELAGARDVSHADEDGAAQLVKP
jgi:CMP-N-acetylneuraminate monooxygenase